MSVRSMTGFGSAQQIQGGWEIRVSLKTVNHRGLDIRVHGVKHDASLESGIAKRIKSTFQRGRVDMQLQLSRVMDGNQVALGIDPEAFASVCTQLTSLAEQNNLAMPLRWEEVFSFKHSFLRNDDERETLDQNLVLEVVDQAIAELVESRRREGASIAEDLLGHCRFLQDCVHKVRDMRPELLGDWRSRLEARLEEVALPKGVTLDEQRLAQEVVIFAERSDIAEEIQRAGAHLEHIENLLTAECTEPLGKKLDFYLQEMIRETNTMGSKSNFADLTHIVVEMKATIERMREQACNVE